MPLTEQQVRDKARDVVEAARGPEWERLNERFKAERRAQNGPAAERTLWEMTEHFNAALDAELDKIDDQLDMMRVAVAVNEHLARAAGLRL